MAKVISDPDNPKDVLGDGDKSQCSLWCLVLYGHDECAQHVAARHDRVLMRRLALGALWPCTRGYEARHRLVLMHRLVLGAL